MSEQNTTRNIRASDAATGSTVYSAAARGAVLFDRSHEGRLRLTGEDRASWLQGLVTNDVAALRVGEGCEAAYLTAQGRMISDLRVLAREDALWIDLPTMTAATVRERFERFVITEDVVVEDVCSSTARLALHGGGAPGVLAAALERMAASLDVLAPGFAAGDLVEMKEHASKVLSLPTGANSVALLIAGARRFGRPGFDLYVPRTSAAAVRQRLLEAGAVEGDAATWETLRVESGVPAFGIDMDESTIPLEAGLEARAISQTKGCYVGQEVIVRVLHRGHGRVARRLVRLVPVGDDTETKNVVCGTRLHSTTDGRDIGRITSAAYSPAAGHLVALGYVHRDFAEPGTQVDVRNLATGTRLEVRALTPPS